MKIYSVKINDMYLEIIEDDDGKFIEPDIIKKTKSYGTALKPTHEPIMVAQKPIEKNYCYNIQKWGVGGLNIDGSRIELNGEIIPINILENWSGFGEEDKPDYEATINDKGRYPSNTIFSCECQKMKLKNNISQEIKNKILDFYGEKS